jgi:hypothetical protein
MQAPLKLKISILASFVDFALNNTQFSLFHCSAKGMYCLNTEDTPYCALAKDAEFGDTRCCTKTKK